MPYTLKTFVSILMTPEIEQIIDVVDNAHHTFGLHAVITSGNDGLHGKPKSLHYRNQAVDFRVSGSALFAQKLLALVKSQLGKDYDVVLEPDHLHVEYDPKGA